MASKLKYTLRTIVLMGMILSGILSLQQISYSQDTEGWAGKWNKQKAHNLSQMKRQVRSLYRLLPEQARVVTGTIESNTTWRSDSHIRINGEVILPKDIRLVIEPGVRVDFGPGASLFLEGVLEARGQVNSPILFTRAENRNSWQRITINPSSITEYDSLGNYLSGTILENVIIEGGGAVSNDNNNGNGGALAEGGMLLLNGASPYLHQLILRNGKSRNGGGLTLVGKSDPWIVGCLFSDNTASGNGGGIYVAMNASGHFIDNIITNNIAGRDGGGIYLSFSSSYLEHNIIETNNAGRDGGALVIGGSTPTVALNVFRDNKAENEGDNVLVRKSIPTIKHNAFFPREDRTSLVTQDFGDEDIPPYVIAKENYWGTVEPIFLGRLFLDARQDPKRPLVKYIPVLDVIPDDIPLQPIDISKFALYEDENYRNLLPTKYVGFDTRIYLQAYGKGANPLLIDWLLVDCMTESGGYLRIEMMETAPNSGEFQGYFQVSSAEIHHLNSIYSHVGDEITLKPLGFNYNKKIYPIELQQPFIRGMNLVADKSFYDKQMRKDLPPGVMIKAQDGVGDLNHLLDDRFNLSLKYFEPAHRPQRASRMNVRNADGSLFWTSDIVPGVLPDLQYLGPELVGGNRYTVEVQVTQGIRWSDISKINFRKNSIPTVFKLENPGLDETVKSRNPGFSLKHETDKEGDELWAKYDVMAVSSSDTSSKMISQESDWVRLRGKAAIPVFRSPLSDNTVYQVRAKISDGLEASNYSSWRQFVVNEKNDVPGEFEIIYPGEGAEVFNNETISWTSTYDPDPYERLVYTVSLGTATGSTLSNDINISELKGLEQLEDDTNLELVIAVQDLAGAVTLVKGGGHSIYVNLENDPPSIPVGFNVPDGQTARQYPVEISWNAAQDPDRSDSSATLSYELEFSQPGWQSSINLVTFPGETYVIVNQLNDNQEYLWRIRAVDDENLASDWSNSQSLIVNSVEEAPTQFQLLSPVNGNQPYQLSAVEFSWESALDPDPRDQVSYQFMLAKNSNFGPGSIVTQSRTATTNYVYEANLEHAQDYFWKVIATDKTGLSTSSETFSFRIESTPSIPQLYEINQVELNMDTQFSWSNSIDPNPNDQISYRVEVSPDNRFSAGRVAVADRITDNKINLRKIAGIDRILTDNDPIVIRVKARDNHGFESEWSNLVSSKVNLRNDNPGQPVAINPKTKVENNRPEFTWNASTDADPSDPQESLKYEIEVGLNSNPNQIVSNGRGTVTGNTSWKPSRALIDNSELIWRVRAVDDEGASSPWSTSVRFQIDSKPEKPGAFTLVQPSNESSFEAGANINFRWNESVDPDLNSSVEYILVIDGQEYGPVKATSYNFSANLKPGKVKWQVIARDNTGLSVKSPKSVIVIKEASMAESR